MKNFRPIPYYLLEVRPEKKQSFVPMRHITLKSNTMKVVTAIDPKKGTRQIAVVKGDKIKFASGSEKKKGGTDERPVESGNGRP